jgi:hypothetical protein
MRRLVSRRSLALAPQPTAGSLALAPQPTAGSLALAPQPTVRMKEKL